jgi:hypothetical protein
LANVLSQSAPDNAPGCPILMQTALGIKMMVQVPKAEIVINLANLIRFLGAHFLNHDEFKAWLERSKYCKPHLI